MFANMYSNEFDVNPFIKCITIASTCMRVFRKNFLKKNQIGLIHNGNYRRADTQSVKALQWLLWMEKKILDRPMIHAGRSRKKRTIVGVLADDFCEPLPSEDHRGVTLNFLGCIFHGCVKTYPHNRDRKLFCGDGK